MKAEKVEQAVPKPPGTLGPGGRRLWHSVVEEFELRQFELDLLERACIALDRLSALDEVLHRQGLDVDGRAHPALVESRMQAIVFARLITALRLPDEEDRKPQRRGSRGVYQVYRRERQALIDAQRSRLKVVR